MFTSFRKIFKPAIDERIDFIKGNIVLHKNAFGECRTCVHHEESKAPGFVMDYGSCKKKCKHFPEKVCRLKKIECSDYEELEKLQREKEKSLHTDNFSSFIISRFERRERCLWELFL